MADIELRRVPNHCGDMVPGGERLPYDMTADPPGRSEDRQLHLVSACRGLPGCLRGCGCVGLYAKCCWHFDSPCHIGLVSFGVLAAMWLAVRFMPGLGPTARRGKVRGCLRACCWCAARSRPRRAARCLRRAARVGNPR